MANRITEKSVVDASLRWLKSLPHCKARKRRGGVSNAGEPDIEGCICGLHFEIECKTPGNNPTKLQEAKMEQWKKTGAIVAVSRSLAETKSIIYYGILNAVGNSNQIMDQQMEIMNLIAEKGKI